MILSFFLKAIIYLIMAFIFSSCGSTGGTKKAERLVQKLSYQKVYLGSYDQVWRAAQLSLKYPIAVNNMDHGVIETEVIDAGEGFLPPGSASKKPVDGITYKINLFLTKGKVKGKESVRVNVKKIIERKKDFFAEDEKIESDGIEEGIILYRISRELVIDEAIKKSQEPASAPQVSDEELTLD